MANSTESWLDYDALLEEYSSGMLTRLRSFGSEVAFLETWVPDEDPLKSLFDLLEAACDAGETSLKLVVSQGLVDHVTQTSLMETACRFGETSLLQEKGRWYLSLTHLHAPISSSAIASDTATTVEAKALQFEESTAFDVFAPRRFDTLPDGYDLPADAPSAWLAEHPAEASAEARFEGLSLFLWIDEPPHLITRAGFSGPVSPAEQAVLSLFCAQLAGLPVQEASDHAAQRLEMNMRNSRFKRRVPGILGPQCADPAFVMIETLIRAALTDWRAGKDVPLSNRYDVTPGEAWLAASEFDRKALLAEAIVDWASYNSASPEDVTITAIEYDVRIVVALSGKLALGDKQAILMGIENAIQRRVDPRLEIYQEELKDINKLRRLSDTQLDKTEALS